jgi:hypothetical protein
VARRVRGWLGVPAVSSRTWLLVILLFLGLVLGATVLTDFVLKFGQYAPWYYEPKDFQREEQLQRESGKSRAPK